MLGDSHVAELAQQLPGYVARIEWPVARLRQERTVALRALLATAVERSPWHRGRLGGHDIASLSECDIVDLPVMTKTDLLESGAIPRHRPRR